MRKEKIWSQIEYEYAYRQMRRGSSFEEIYANDEIACGHLKAADYSYQAYGYEPNGWVSDQRHKRFLQIKWRILSREELPF